jgi:hypothetical protein
VPEPPQPPAERSSIDDIIDLYKRDVDRTLIHLQLRKTPAQRAQDLEGFCRTITELRGAMERARSKSK